MVDTLRPSTFDEFIGQHELKARLQVHIESTLTRHQTLEHVFLAAPPGVGKTSLGVIIANALGVQHEIVTMPLTNAALTKVLRGFGDGVVILDEIHRGNRHSQEDLLPLIEFGYVRQANGSKFYVDEVTFVGTTTDAAKVILPLRDRFTIKPPFAEYTDDEMATIVKLMAEKMKLVCNDEVALKLGRAAAGVPRNARQFVFAARDLAYTGKSVRPDDVLEFCGVAPDGLSADHVRYLQIVALSGTVGLATLAMMLNLHEDATRELERLLIHKGMLLYTDRGRELTRVGVARSKGTI